MKKTGNRRFRGLNGSKSTCHSSLFTGHPSALLRTCFLLFTLYSLLSTVFATTYRTDATGGPETLSTEVTAAFDAWKAIDSKLEITPTEENPEALFQYGTSERFNPDTLSITVQRQQEGRQLIILLSPSAENRQRILLHEAGVAIGLTPQSPPSLAAISETVPEPSSTSTSGEDTTSTPEISPLTSDDTTTTQGNPDSEGTTEETEETQTTPSETTETTETTEITESNDDTSQDQEESTPDNTDSTTDIEADDTTNNPQDATPSETENSETGDTSETSDIPNSEDSATPIETPASSIKPWQTVMNPSINPSDSTELSDGEKDLLKALQLFAKEDINKDGNVNFYDLIAISQAFGQRNVNDPSDINKDGIVNQTDVDLLRKVYTFSDPSSTAPGQTEPSQTEPSQTEPSQTEPDTENQPIPDGESDSTPDTQNPDGE